MNRIGLSSWVTIACGLAGCAGSFVETTPLNAAPRALAPRTPGSVEVYASAPPTRPHVDIALLRANQSNYGDVDTPRMMQSLLEQAGKMGCDAIFVSGAAQRQGAIDDLRFLDPGSHALLATCIAYSPNSGVPSALETATPSPQPVNAVVLVKPEPSVQVARPAAIVDNIATSPQRR